MTKETLFTDRLDISYFEKEFQASICVNNPSGQLPRFLVFMCLSTDKEGSIFHM